MKIKWIFKRANEMGIAESGRHFSGLVQLEKAPRQSKASKWLAYFNSCVCPFEDHHCKLQPNTKMPLEYLKWSVTQSKLSSSEGFYMFRVPNMDINIQLSSSNIIIYPSAKMKLVTCSKLAASSTIYGNWYTICYQQLVDKVPWKTFLVNNSRNMKMKLLNKMTGKK